MIIKIVAELEYDAESTHADDEEARAWFFGILEGDDLMVSSEEYGDIIGRLTVTEILEVRD